MAAPLTRWATSTVALDCLGVTMQVPYEAKYTVEAILSGDVRCPGPSDRRFAMIVAACLIVVHVLFMMAPVASIPFLFRAQSRLQPKIASFPIVVMSMPLFVLGAAGEVAEHCFDNWLYLNSRNDAYNFVFYFMTVVSNAVLAAGLDKNKLQVVLSLLAAATVPAMFVFTDKAYTYPDNTYLKVPASIPIWIGMFITTTTFIVRAWGKLKLPSGKRGNWVHTIIILVTYVLGVYFANQILLTGNQWWHLLTASNFAVGFLTQVHWLCTAYTGKAKAASKKLS